MTVENISWSISTKECCRPRRGVEPATSWSPVGRRIQLSHRGRLFYKYVCQSSDSNNAPAQAQIWNKQTNVLNQMCRRHAQVFVAEMDWLAFTEVWILSKLKKLQITKFKTNLWLLHLYSVQSYSTDSIFYCHFTIHQRHLYTNCNWHKCLTLSMLGKFSADDNLKWKKFSYFSQTICFDSSCELSPMETICMTYHIYFFFQGKINIYIYIYNQFAVCRVCSETDKGWDGQYECYNISKSFFKLILFFV